MFWKLFKKKRQGGEGEKEDKNKDSYVYEEMFKECGGKLKGEYVILQPWEHVKVINPVTLPGQSEILFDVFVYRLAKWRFNMAKFDEYVVSNPVHTPSHLTVLTQKQTLEQQIKTGLASVAQAISDYELLKHDERRYREILDFFRAGKKDEHVLRSLFVDRVDAHTGEGYSMISMARRWPTIISDFLKLSEEDTTVEAIMKKLNVSRAEATVLKTKNELFKEWKKTFIPDVIERYKRIKTLLSSREKSIEEYKKWLVPVVNKYKRIREEAEFEHAAQVINPLLFANVPMSGIRARLWFWRGFSPEEMGKPMMVKGEVEIYDDFVKKWKKKIEERYNVKFSDEEVKKLVEKWSSPGKMKEEISVHTGLMIDRRYIYYYFFDIKYEVDYYKGSQGPLEMEDQYFHIFPYLISQNVLLVLLLELEAKKRQFENYIDELIGLEKTEKKSEEEVSKLLGERGKEKVEKTEKKKKLDLASSMKKISDSLKPLRRYFFKGGPYETNLKERITKLYGDYAGHQIADVVNLLKETCFRLSGQGL
ncbi:MAG: hypothetical protein DRP03_02500 [Candidatus Aenigmatarchaeota archaeon]|nr:MAG: hypothetical protein DRP03_02500 [Candidatus Aenigmarchaeota archaeon]